MDRDSNVGTTASKRSEADDLTPGVPHERPVSTRRQTEQGRIWAWAHHAPFLQLLTYYVVVVGVVALLTVLFPGLREPFFMPVHLPAVAGQQALQTGVIPFQAPLTEYEAVNQAVERAFTTLVVILGALLLVVPVAWIYMRTKRLRYDPALIRSVIILPIVVAGIALVVKNSIALAFSLAGIVAAVRFRNTLKDPQDAVYIFLTIGIGLSAGVQALDVALVMSMIFNFVVLGLWRYNVGSIYGGSYGRTGVISAGNPALLLAQSPTRRREIRLDILEKAEELEDETDGILLVHTAEPEMARHAVQETMSGMAKQWHLVSLFPRGRNHTTLEYLVRLKKKTDPTDLVGAIEEHWSHQVVAVEYFSFLTRDQERNGEEDESAGKKTR